MDNMEYGDDLGVVDTRIADGELKRSGLGVAKKVAVGAGALAAGAGAFIVGCKGANKLGWIKATPEGSDPSLFRKAADFNLKNSFDNVFGQNGTILGAKGVVGGTLAKGFNWIAGKCKADGIFGKAFAAMGNYPILAAAGLAGAGFFVYKGVKKLINKAKGNEEPSFAR